MTKTEISQENQQIFYETSKHLQLGQFEDAYNLTKNLFSLTPEDPTVLKLYPGHHTGQTGCLPYS